MTYFPKIRLLGAGVLLALASVFPGCGSAAQNRAQDGVKLLDQCDLRGAHQAFVDAYGMDSNDPAIALAFALSDVVLLPEDPALETLRPRFGFTKPFDTTFLWSQGGFMDQASKKTLTCDALGDLVRASLPNPALDKTSPTPFADVLDKTLTFGDMRDAGLALGPRFDKLSKAFETAANAASADGVDIKGGCGANELVLQKPELYVLAGAFALLEASFQLAKTYDGSVRLWPLVASNDATAAADPHVAQPVHIQRELHVELHRRHLERERCPTELVDGDVRSEQPFHVDVRVSVTAQRPIFC